MDRFSDLTCPICQDLFENVVTTSCCSTGYCSSCLDESLRATKGTCPSCRQPLDIFQCTPNKMVQRMVDNLPAECTYCSSSLTRSIAEEHIAKCEKRPQQPGSHLGRCPIHQQPLSDFCLQDRQAICSHCASVGSHRHHKSSHKSFVASSSVSLPFPNGSTETEVTMLTYASLICLDSGIAVTGDVIRSILSAAGCRISNDLLIEQFVQHSDKFDQWLSPYGVEANNNITSVSSGVQVTSFDEKAAAAEYEILKERYHNEQFNFAGLHIKAVPICQYLLPKVKNHVYVLVEIRVGKKEEDSVQTRAPFSVSLVLDRSGSMAGSKLTKAKAAIKGVIENLKPSDVLHLVEYDNTASVVFQDGTVSRKQELLSMVDTIEARGSTNLSDGTNLGFKLLNEQKASIDIKRMFLFSDGCANAGIISQQGICELISKYRENGVNTSSFGIGDDFDERIMRGVSDNGHGHYFFIDSSDKIPAMLDKAFHGLSRTVASNVVLKMRGSKGRIVKKLKGNEDLLKGIPLGDLREKDLKQVLVEIVIEEDASDQDLEVLQFELSYDRTDEFVPQSPQRGSLSMRTSSDISNLSQMEDEVLVYLKINECGDLDNTVVKLMEGNNLDEALVVKREVVEILKDLVPKDKVGFAKVLLLRAQARLYDLEQLKSKKSAKSFESVRKAIDRDSREEEEADMGFGLFD